GADRGHPSCRSTPIKKSTPTPVAGLQFLGGCLRPRHLVPFDGALQPFTEGGRRLEAERLAGAAGIERAARLAVWLGRVPHDLALKAYQLGNQLGQVLDADLHPGAEVDRLRAVVMLGRQRDTPCSVLHVEELARRRASTPSYDPVVPALLRLNELANQRRDHVRGGRVKVVTRAVQIGRQQVDAVEAI